MKNNKEIAKKQGRIRRHKKVRSKISGTASIPRLNLFRSNKGLFVQLINDNLGVTLVSASEKEIKEKMIKTETAKEIGKLIAKKALEKKIEKVVFDRGGYRYHGRAKALAEGAREGGLVF